MFRVNRVKQKLQRGEAVFGVVHALAHPPVAELIGLAGCDYVLIDGEHGVGGHAQHLGCVQAVASTAAHALFRVASNDRALIKRVLDLGVEGVMAPDIGSAEGARELVASCRYPPDGRRGYAASGIRASDYGYATARYLRDVDMELLIIAMIESAAGVEAAEAIAAVEGIDAIQIGANDLSYDLGVAEDFANPTLIRAIAHVEAATLAAGKALGGAPMPGTDTAALLARGYRMITIGRDIGFLTAGLSAALAYVPSNATMCP